MTSVNKRLLPGRTLNKAVSGPDGNPPVRIECLPISPGSTVGVEFESVGPRWRKGIFIATEGKLATGHDVSRAVSIWADTAPPIFKIDVLETDGRLVFHNIWDSGRGYGMGSQSHTSGMYMEELPDGGRRYSCTDIGLEPDFSRLVFTISID